MIANLTDLKQRYIEQASQIWRDKTCDRPPCLTCLYATNNESAQAYMASLTRTAEKTCVTVDSLALPDAASRWIDMIQSLNMTDTVDGVLVISPPKELVNYNTLIADSKNVEGNDFDDRLDRVSVTAQAIVETIAFLQQKATSATKASNKELLEGLDVVVIGYGKAVGKPLTYLLMRHHVGSAVALHEYSSTLFGRSVINNCTVLVCATGIPNVLRAYVDPHELQNKIIVDAGIRIEDGKIKGDVEPEKWLNNMVTPVPGGVGQITTAMILRNTSWAARGLLK